MSIFGSLYTAVAGLNANSFALGVISDNIANSNTTGYKDTGTDFSTLVTQSGSNQNYSPGGVQTTASYNVAQQGSIQSASASTDLAISGGGLFVVNSTANDSIGDSYTRAGDFTVDENGNMKNSEGYFLQGQPLTAAQSEAVANGNESQLTATSLSSLQTVNVNGIGGNATSTKNVTIAANLPASDNNSSPARTMTVPVYDSQGLEHDMTLSFTKAPGTAAVASTQDYTLAGSPATGDSYSVTVDGNSFTTSGLTATTPTVTDVANAINNAFQTGGSAYTATVVGGAIRITDPAGNPLTSSITSSNNAVTLTAGTAANGTPAVAGPANTWVVTASIANAGATTVSIATGDNIVKFNADGSLNTAGTTFDSANSISIGWDPAASGGTSPQTLTVDLGSTSSTKGTTQLGSNYTISSINQDGVKYGNFTSVSIDKNGVVTANFDNGQSKAIYIVPLATFANEGGLSPQSGTAYAGTTGAGTPVLTEAGTGAGGSIDSSSLESSTVDIATEFSKLIVAQNAYQANSKVVTTTNTMLQDLMQVIQ